MAVEHQLKLHIVGSGSKGNCAVVENIATGECIMIDTGMPKRDVIAASKKFGFDLAEIRAIIITHNHSDHIKNFDTIYKMLRDMGTQPVIYVNEDIFNQVDTFERFRRMHNHRFIEVDDKFPIGKIDVEVLKTSHDAIASCALRFELKHDTIGFLTDTGVVGESTARALANVRLLAIESNHDKEMLQLSDKPDYIIARVMGKGGHMSNEYAAKVLDMVMGKKMETVVAMHVSETDNHEEYVREAFEKVINDAGFNIEILIAKQKEPLSID